MMQKTVLLLEDHQRDLKQVRDALSVTGFRVIPATNIEDARAAALNLGEELDVLLLDMEIPGAGMTGADFGLEVKEQQQDWPPEFLINSVYDYNDYYRLAFQLDAATYLRKPTKSDEIVRYVRVLAIRRYLSPGQPQLLATIETIARESGSASDAMLRFCSDILYPQFEICLRNVTFLLLVEHRGSIWSLGGPGLPLHSSAYKTLLKLSHLTSAQNPLVVEPGKVALFPDESSAESEEAAKISDGILQSLKDAAFVPLLKTADLKLSLGVLPRYPALRFIEDALELAKLAGSLIQPALVKHLLALTEQFTEIFTKQRAILEATADFCLYVGQEQSNAFESLFRSGSLSYRHLPADLMRLLTLGENLRRAGELLTWISLPSDLRGHEETAKVIPMESIVDEALKDLANILTPEDREAVTVQGECRVFGKPDDLLIAVQKILGWLTQRIVDTPVGTPPEVAITCSTLDNRARVVFEDRSRRLPKGLRERIFSLFSAAVPEDFGNEHAKGEILGLYLSKILIETENSGRIEDCSDELPGDVGHCFVVSFPAPVASTALTAFPS